MSITYRIYVNHFAESGIRTYDCVLAAEMIDIRMCHIGREWISGRERPAALNRPFSAPRLQRPRIVGFSVLNPAIALSLVMVIGACQQNQPPPAPTVAVAPPPAQRQPPPQPAHRIVHLVWTFDIESDRCIASAADHLTTLTVTVVRNATIDLNLAFPSSEASRIRTYASAHLRFSGPSGNWNLQASGNARHGISASSAPDEVSLGRVLILLGGGTLNITVSPSALPPLHIPPAGPEGQAWSDCARRQMI